MKSFLFNVAILLPWVLVAWVAGRGISGEWDGLLTFVLLIILIPFAAMANLATRVAFAGHTFVQHLKTVQRQTQEANKPLETTNYADLKWYDPRRLWDTFK